MLASYNCISVDEFSPRKKTLFESDDQRTSEITGAYGSLTWMRGTAVIRVTARGTGALPRSFRPAFKNRLTPEASMIHKVDWIWFEPMSPLDVIIQNNFPSGDLSASSPFTSPEG
jgi:hypothetical protein